MRTIRHIEPLDRRNQPPWILILAMLTLVGCSKDAVQGPSGDLSAFSHGSSESGAPPLIQDGSEPPAGLVPIKRRLRFKGRARSCGRASRSPALAAPGEPGAAADSRVARSGPAPAGSRIAR
jgi:hypothetical protein